MKLCAWTCAAMLSAVPASAQDLTLGVDLLPGHPVHHESKGEAGVVMALTITPDHGHAAEYRTLCEDLRRVAGLRPEIEDELRLEVIFVLPYREMAVEGWYLPDEGTLGRGTLVQGEAIARERLDGIVTRAGIPAHVLDETDVEHQISCELDAPVWRVRWDDIRRLAADEDPDAVIERAWHRFMAVHRSVVEHNAEPLYVHKTGTARCAGEAEQVASGRPRGRRPLASRPPRCQL